VQAGRVPVVSPRLRTAAPGTDDGTIRPQKPGRDHASTEEEREMASKAREIMSGGVDCIGENDTIAEAAKLMQRLGVGALPICGEDDRLKGMVTDRDIVIEVVAAGQDPQKVTAGSLAKGKPVTIGADDDIDELVRTMSEHQVKRLPVIDGHRLVGIVTEADVAANAPQDQVVELVRNVYANA
jgi:CBS domain-containing protein